MDIKEIKTQLSITQVLSYYGIKADKNSRINCPFHDDKTPSMQIYPATNTYCCFSGNCNAGTGDAIEFIQLKENCSKHEALKKATAMLTATSGQVFIQTPTASAIKPNTNILSTFFDYYKTGLPSIPPSNYTFCGSMCRTNFGLRRRSVAASGGAAVPLFY
jgi:DNA primase